MTSLVLSLVALAAPECKAGVAVKVITPDQPMWMAGYAFRTKPAEGKVHDLFAMALVLQDAGGKRLVLVTTDLRRDVVHPVRPRPTCRSRTWPTCSRTCGGEVGFVAGFCFCGWPL
jgi:hypothetical protein